jgi:hypothetical protein
MNYTKKYMWTSGQILNLRVCILLRVSDQVEKFLFNTTLFQYFFMILFKLLKINFWCTYFRLKMVVQPKHVADNLNKIVNNY